MLGKLAPEPNAIVHRRKRTKGPNPLSVKKKSAAQKGAVRERVASSRVSAHKESVDGN